MAIVHLGAKRVQGTKIDRVVDSLGSSADGTNTGITLVTATSTAEQTTGAEENTLTPDTRGMGEYVVNTSSTLYGKTLTDVQFNIKKATGGDAPAAGEVVRARHYNSSNTLIHTYWTKDATTLPTSFAWTSETTLSGDTAYVVGDYFVCEFTETDGTSPTGQVKINRKANGSGTKWDSTNSGFINTYFSASNYTDTNRDIQFKITLSDSSAVKLGTGAYSFDGSNDYVECGTTSDWKFLHDGSKSTIAFWAKLDDTSQGDPAGIICTSNINNSSTGTAVFISNGDEICYLTNNGSTSTQNSQNIHTIPDTDWHHYAFTYDGSLANTNLVFYFDGVQKATGNKQNTFATGNSTNPLRIGRGNSVYFGGELDDIGIYKRVLTATEISDLVNKTGATDGLGSDADLTLSGTTSYATGLIGKCLYADFSGTESQQATPAGNFVSQARTNNDDFNFIHTAGQAWTINFWVKPTVAENGAIQQLIGNESYNGSSLSGFNIKILDRSASSEVRRVSTDFKNDGNVIYSAYNGTDGDMPNNTNWSMITVRCNGATTSGATALDICINGGTSNNDFSTPNGTCTRSSSTATARNATYGLMFGRNLYKAWGSANSNADPFDGSFDEVSIWNRELTDAECVALYNSGSGAVTTTAVTNHSELKAYWNFNDNVTNQASPVLTGALVSSLSDKSNLKANYTMDSTSLGLTPTKETLDSTNGTTDWVEVGSRYTIDTSNNQIDFALVRDNSGYGTTTALYDLGASSMLNDTKFVLRYRLNFGTIDNPTRTPSVQFVFGAYSNTDGISISQDCITMFCGATSNTGNNWNFGVTDANGAYSQNPYVLFDATGTGVTGNNNWYVEMVRTSASAGVARLYSDSTYETLVQEKSLAFSSANPQNLRYIGAKFFGSNTTATPTYNGYMSDVKIYNGVSSLEGCANDFSATSALDGQTNLPVNTIFEQTNDTPSYWFKQSDNSWLWSPVGVKYNLADGNTGWEVQSATYFYTTGTNELFFKATNEVGDAVYDLGAGNVSDTKWTLRMKVNFTEIGGGNGSNVGFVLSSTDKDGGSNDSQNQLGWAWGEPPTDGGTGSGQNYIGIRNTTTASGVNAACYPCRGTAGDAVGFYDDGWDDSATGTDYYIEVKRTSQTDATFNIWTGSYGGTEKVSLSVTNLLDATGLRYLKFMQRQPAESRPGNTWGTIKEMIFYNGVVPP